MGDEEDPSYYAPLAITEDSLQPFGNQLNAECFFQQQELDEDLAECIAVWQDSSRQSAQATNLHFPVIPRRRPGSVTGSGQPECSSQASRSNVGASVDFRNCHGPVFAVNVGGVIFRTTSSTLQKAPFFDAWLQRAPRDRNGTSCANGALDVSGTDIFVDRSGELFGYILEYLRSGNWLLKDKATDHDFVNALRDEACFYGLDGWRECAPLPRISEYVTVWQFQNDTAIYVDCFEQTIREDPDHQGLFRLCKYTGVLPLDQQTCTKRFKATTHNLQSVLTYFAMRGFSLNHVVEGSMVTHTTSADGQSRSGYGTQYVMSRLASFPALPWQAAWAAPNAHGTRPVGIEDGSFCNKPD